jgi:hypothetical protein
MSPPSSFLGTNASLVKRKKTELTCPALFAEKEGGVPSKSALVPVYLLCQKMFLKERVYCAVPYHHNTNPHTEHAPRTRPAAAAHL